MNRASGNQAAFAGNAMGKDPRPEGNEIPAAGVKAAGTV